MVHPALLDPAATITIKVGDADPIVPLRGLPGHAAFAVPPTLTDPADTQLEILVDGGVAASLPFTVLAPAQVAADPGVRLMDTHGRLLEALDELPALIDDVGTFVELADTDRAILRGMLLASTDQLRR